MKPKQSFGLFNVILGATVFLYVVLQMLRGEAGETGIVNSLIAWSIVMNGAFLMNSE